MSSAVLLALLAAAPVFQAEVPHLVAGSGREVVLRLQIPAEWAALSPTVELTTNAGSVSAARAAGPGAFTATYSLPQERYPQAALVLAEIVMGKRRERVWLPIPIHGTDTLKLKTKALSTVHVTIADRAFGPHRANATGQVDVPVEVPPGVSMASVRSVDRVGNAKTKRLDLSPPPYARVRTVSVTGLPRTPVAQPLELELFHIRPDGSPDPDAPSVTASAGNVGRVVPAGPPGVFRVTFEPPTQAGEVTLSVSPRGRGPHAVSQRFAVDVLSGPATTARVVLPVDSFQSGSASTVAVQLELEDAHGNRAELPEAARLVADLGSIEHTPGAATATWRLPDAFMGRDRASIALESPGVRAEASLRLIPGAPAVAELALSRTWLRAGVDTIDGVLKVRDRSGNLVRPATVEASGASGTAELERDGEHFRVRYAVPREAPTGEDMLEIRLPTEATSAAPPTSLASAPVWVLPYQPAWQVSVGLIALGQHNLSAGGAGAAVEAGVTPGRGPIRLFTRIAGRAAQDVLVPHGDSRVWIRHQALTGTMGARYTHALSARLAVHASAEGGAQLNKLQLALEHPHPTVNETRTVTPWPWSYVVRAAAGLSAPVGPGRLIAELGWSHSPIAEAVQGSVGGANVAVGYLWELR